MVQISEEDAKEIQRISQEVRANIEALLWMEHITGRTYTMMAHSLAAIYNKIEYAINPKE